MWSIPLCSRKVNKMQIIKPNHPNKISYCNFNSFNFKQSVPVAAQSKAGVYGRLLAGIVGSNAAGACNVCLLRVLCVVQV